MIPKIAHFVWLDSDIPKWAETCIRKFQLLHPDWKLNLILERDGAADSNIPVQMTARMMGLQAVATMGGIYLDSDIYILRNISDLLIEDFVASRDGVNLDAGVFGGRAGEYWLRESVFFSNGAIYARRALSADTVSEAINTTIIQHRRNIRILPWHYFNPFTLSGDAIEFIYKNAESREDELNFSKRRFGQSDVLPFGVHIRAEFDPEKLLSVDYKISKARPFTSTKAATTDLRDATTVDKAVNFSKALGRVGGNILAGNKVLVTTEEKDRRMDICKACDFFDNGSCRKCGCNLAFKNRLTSEHCPVGKW